MSPQSNDPGACSTPATRSGIPFNARLCAAPWSRTGTPDVGAGKSVLPQDKKRGSRPNRRGSGRRIIVVSRIRGNETGAASDSMGGTQAAGRLPRATLQPPPWRVIRRVRAAPSAPAHGEGCGAGRWKNPSNTFSIDQPTPRSVLLVYALPMIARRGPGPCVPGFRWKPAADWLCKA